jgi:hypothetical protein
LADSSVVIKFLGDTKQLTRSIAGIKQDSQGLGGGFTRATSALKGMALPALGAAAAVFKLASNAGESADRLLDLEQITGISTDKLQEMENVAKEAGVSQEFYAEATLEVTKAMDRILRGTGPAAEALEELGVAAENADGSMRSAEAITDDVITALLGIEDASTRAALAEDVFKRKSQDLVTVLGLGEQGMDRAREAAHELGIVQSGEALQAANDFRVSMEELETKLQAVSLEMLQELYPVIVDVIIPAVMWMVDVVGRAKDGWDDFLDVITGDIEELSRVKSNIGDVNTELKTMERTAPKTTQVFVESFGEAQSAVKSLADEVRKATDPAFALRRAQEDFAAASKKVDEARKGTPEHTQALIDEMEAQADLNYATDKFEEVAGDAIEYMYDLGFQAGQARLEIMGAVEAITEWNQLEISPKTLVVGAVGGADAIDDIYERDFLRETQRGVGILGNSRRAPGIR